MKFAARLAQWLLQPPRSKRSPRYVQPGLVAYYWEGSASLPHEISNISSTGAYLRTAERWYPGTLIQVTLTRNQAVTNQNAPAEFIQVSCQVVRHDGNGIGLRFISPDRQERKALDHFISNVVAGMKQKNG